MKLTFIILYLFHFLLATPDVIQTIHGDKYYHKLSGKIEGQNEDGKIILNTPTGIELISPYDIKSINFSIQTLYGYGNENIQFNYPNHYKKPLLDAYGFSAYEGANGVNWIFSSIFFIGGVIGMGWFYSDFLVSVKSLDLYQLYTSKELFDFFASNNQAVLNNASYGGIKNSLTGFYTSLGFSIFGLASYIFSIIYNSHLNKLKNKVSIRQQNLGTAFIYRW